MWKAVSCRSHNRFLLRQSPKPAVGTIGPTGRLIPQIRGTTFAKFHMQTHPFTVKYLESFMRRPGMYIQDFDLRQLEHQLHGFEAGLNAAGVFGEAERFNTAFSGYLLSATKLYGIQGWAADLIEKFGQNEQCLEEFLSLLKQAIPVLSSPESQHTHGTPNGHDS